MYESKGGTTARVEESKVFIVHAIFRYVINHRRLFPSFFILRIKSNVWLERRRKGSIQDPIHVLLWLCAIQPNRMCMWFVENEMFWFIATAMDFLGNKYYEFWYRNKNRILKWWSETVLLRLMNCATHFSSLMHIINIHNVIILRMVNVPNVYVSFGSCAYVCVLLAKGIDCSCTDWYGKDGMIVCAICYSLVRHQGQYTIQTHIS